MAKLGYLADTSVLHRVGRNPRVSARVAALRNEKRLWTCDVVSLELGYSARNRNEWLAIQSVQRGLNQSPITEAVTARALQSQGLMTDSGTHRVKIADLMIAAAAEAAEIAVLHYDADFDRIGEVTDQPTEWIAERGSID